MITCFKFVRYLNLSVEFLSGFECFALFACLALPAPVWEFFGFEAFFDFVCCFYDFFSHEWVQYYCSFGIVVYVVYYCFWYLDVEFVFEHHCVCCCLYSVPVPYSFFWRVSAFEFYWHYFCFVAFKSVYSSF